MSVFATPANDWHGKHELGREVAVVVNVLCVIATPAYLHGRHEPGKSDCNAAVRALLPPPRTSTIILAFPLLRAIDYRHLTGQGEQHLDSRI